MAAGPITLWHIEGGKMEAVADFFFLASKSPWTVTAAIEDACSLEGKLWQTQTAYYKAETSLCWQPV